MSDEEKRKIIEEQYAELASKHGGLKLFREPGGLWTIEGPVDFRMTYKGIPIEDDYKIRILLAGNYPESPPLAQETGGRIPKDFHKNEHETLCIGAPLKIRMVFAAQPTLLGFVENLLVKYLFSYSYYEKYGSMPFEELSHGGKGIVEHYQELFEISEGLSIAELIWILINGYKGHYECPCKSGKKLRNCHGPVLLEIQKYQPKQEFLYDLYQVLKFIIDSGNKKIPHKYRSVFSKANVNMIYNNRKS